MALKGKKILFIGAGNMGEAMIKGLLKSGLALPGDLAACDLDLAKLEQLKPLGVETMADAGDAAPICEMAVLATKPQGFPDLFKALKGAFQPRQLIVSIAAGIPIRKIEEGLGKLPVVRVMPNTPALLGLGASGYCLGSLATAEHAMDVEELLNCFGISERVDESQMDAVTALSGSGPAYVFLFMEALQEAGHKLGLDAEASFRLASQTLKGAAAMIEERKDSPSRLREKVTSPGGTTAAALKAFEDGKLKELVLQALTAARDRGRELGA